MKLFKPYSFIALVYPYPWYSQRLRHKDVFLFPAAISSALQCPIKECIGKFIAGDEREGQNRYILRMALLLNVASLGLRLLILRIIARNKSPCFVFFHIGWSTALLVSLCHCLWGKNAKIIVKSDFNFENSISKNNGSWLEVLSIASLRRADNIIVGETKKAVEALKGIFYGGRASVMLCPNGIDERSLPENIDPLRDIDVLIVSRYRVVEKGCYTYALVVPLLIEAGLNVTLVGDGVSEFLSEIGLINSPHITASESLTNVEILKTMKRSKIFLNLSISESFIIALAEAYAMGCQVICTPVGVGPDLAEQTNNVTLVSSDPREILNAVMSGIKNLPPEPPQLIGTWEEVVCNSGIIQCL